MRIIGIDPGLQCTGYGIVDVCDHGCRLVEGGVVRTDSDAPLELRLHSLFEGVADVMREMQPAIAVVEQLYSKYRHPQTAVLMGHARGVIYLAAAAAAVPVEAYPASLVKKSLTGSGRASKEQVGRMVCHLLSLASRPQPDDITDALALAICHSRGQRSRSGSLPPALQKYSTAAHPIARRK
jgi:crossover junction endodeoxyribonuclease RuvC